MLDHFKERQRVHPALIGMLLLGAVIEAVLTLTHHANLATQILRWVIVAIFIMVAFLFRELSIQVGQDALVFGFGPIRRKVRLAEITGVRILDSAALHAGIGIHRTASGMMAWIARNGPAVEVKIAHADPRSPSGYLISTSRPHDLAAALQSGKTSRAIEGP